MSLNDWLGVTRHADMLHKSILDHVELHGGTGATLCFGPHLIASGVAALKDGAARGLWTWTEETTPAGPQFCVVLAAAPSPPPTKKRHFRSTFDGAPVLVARDSAARAEVTWWLGSDGAVYRETRTLDAPAVEVMRIGPDSSGIAPAEQVPPDALACHVEDQWPVEVGGMAGEAVTLQPCRGERVRIYFAEEP